MNIIVSGMVAGTPGHGGASWAILQYLLGLRRLGHDVWLVEPVARESDIHTGAAYAQATLGPIGLGERWALLAPDRTSAGISHAALLQLADRTDVLLNVSGMLTDESLLGRISVRVYLDLDPGFVQLWHEVEGIDMRFDAHTHFVSLSDAIGRTIPDCGRHWTPTLPPVVLDQWPFAHDLRTHALTTVANWRGYGSIEHDGVHYGQKAHSLRPLIELPRRVRARFLLALAIHRAEAADLEALRSNGWELIDPAAVAATPDEYRTFVGGSWAEFGIAKGGYVTSDSGWFSDRSACYLASGRPVLAQDTGFTRRLPVRDGLFPFSSVEDVASAVDILHSDYPAQRQAARAIAENFLDSDLILDSLLRRVMP